MYGEVEADVGANAWNRRLAIIIVAEKQKQREKKTFRNKK